MSETCTKNISLQLSQHDAVTGSSKFLSTSSGVANGHLLVRWLCTSCGEKPGPCQATLQTAFAWSDVAGGNVWGAPAAEWGAADEPPTARDQGTSLGRAADGKVTAMLAEKLASQELSCKMEAVELARKLAAALGEEENYLMEERVEVARLAIEMATGHRGATVSKGRPPAGELLYVPTVTPVVITHALVQALLTESEGRRRHRGPLRLLDAKEIADLVNKLADSRIDDSLCFSVNTRARLAVFPPNSFDNDAVHKRLVLKYPKLPQLFDAADGHLLVIGGAIHDALRQAQGRDGADLDMLIVGLDEPAASEMLAKLLGILEAAPEGDEDARKRGARPQDAWQDQDREWGVEQRDDHMPDCLFIRSEFQVSALAPDGRVYQFVLCKVGSFSEALELAYVQCTGVGYAPVSGLQATPIAAFCLGAGITIVDPRSGSDAYEHRLLKYHGRGFTMVFPSLAAGTDNLTTQFQLGRLRAQRVLRTQIVLDPRKKTQRPNRPDPEGRSVTLASLQRRVGLGALGMRDLGALLPLPLILFASCRFETEGGGAGADPLAVRRARSSLCNL
jgi:hypothetical protein